MSARDHVLALIDGAWTTQAIASACELGIFEHLAASPSTAASLAAKLGANADAVERLLTGLVTLQLCRRDGDSSYVITDEGKCLLEQRADSLAAWARLSGTRLWGNWAHLTQSVRTGQCARAAVRGHEDFRELDQDPAGAAVFNAAMIDLSRPVGEAAARLLDWSGVGRALDVGGGAGALLAEVLARHPEMTGTVLDLDHAGDGARKYLAQARVASRCAFHAGSFFETVPAGYDAYLLKSVLHNWDDARAADILRHCAAAMSATSRLVLFERLVPEAVGASRHDRNVARSDLNMLVGCGGRERTQAQFDRLFREAGLEWRSTTPLTGEMYAIEAGKASR